MSPKKPPEPPEKPTAPSPKPSGSPSRPPQPHGGPPGQTKKVPQAPPSGYEKWKGPGCGFIYDESKGDPSRGIRPGTKFMDLADSWICPMCKAPKKDFQKVS